MRKDFCRELPVYLEYMSVAREWQMWLDINQGGGCIQEFRLDEDVLLFADDSRLFKKAFLDPRKSERNHRIFVVRADSFTGQGHLINVKWLPNYQKFGVIYNGQLVKLVYQCPNIETYIFPLQKDKDNLREIEIRMRGAA